MRDRKRKDRMLSRRRRDDVPWWTRVGGGAAGCILKGETWNISEGGMDEAPSLRLKGRAAWGGTMTDLRQRANHLMCKCS